MNFQSREARTKTAQTASYTFRSSSMSSANFRDKSELQLRSAILIANTAETVGVVAQNKRPTAGRHVRGVQSPHRAAASSSSRVGAGSARRTCSRRSGARRTLGTFFSYVVVWRRFFRRIIWSASSRQRRRHSPVTGAPCRRRDRGSSFVHRAAIESVIQQSDACRSGLRQFVRRS